MIPRFSISGLMAVVAIVALDFAAFRALDRPSLLSREMAELIVCGMLPMANVLALGLLPFLTRPGPIGGRPYLVRFEVFGWMALLVFFAVCSTATHAVHEGVGDSIKLLGLGPSPLFLVGVVTLMLVPQLALAWLGARLVGGARSGRLCPPTGPHSGGPIDFA